MDTAAIIEGADDTAIADWIATRLAHALGAGKPIAITVPGGTTPFPIVEKLIARDLNWAQIVVWPNDDRVVPEDHPASNTGRLRALFAAVGAEVASLTIMEQVPRFALAWVGMGTDGHTASLFPNVDPQVDDPRSIVQLTPDPLPPEAPYDRISLTLPALLASDALVVVARGAEKRAVLDRALSGEADVPIARLLAAACQPVTVFA